MNTTRLALRSSKAASQLLFKRTKCPSFFRSSCHIKYFSTTENITYSGGHANTGQGGYYGSGGARAKAEAEATANITDDQRSKVLAISTDIEVISLVMDEIEKLEDELRIEQEANEGVTDKAIELRAKMKHLVTSEEFMSSLENLEISGAPVWGLSSSEHDLVVVAREKVNTC